MDGISQIIPTTLICHEITVKTILSGHQIKYFPPNAAPLVVRLLTFLHIPLQSLSAMGDS